MKYGDEKNIIARKASQTCKKLDIQNAVEIEKITYLFSRREFPEHKISMVLPEQLVVMPSNIARVKYPSEFRPELIMTTPDQNLDFTLHYHRNVVLDPLEAVEVAESFRMSGKRMYPASVFSHVDKIDTVNTVVSYYGFQAPAFDADIYSINFVISIEKRLLLGSFNYLYENQAKWDMLIDQMLETICDLSKVEESITAE